MLAKGHSTFFPDNWSPQKIIDEINHAYSNAKPAKNNKIKGEASNGMDIEIIIKNGKIDSAYPLYVGGLK